MKMHGVIGLLSGLILLAGISLHGADSPGLPLDLADRQQRVGMEGDDGSDWLLYGRNYNAWRFSPLTWINKENVGNLELAWMMETGLHDAFECSPIVVDGVMYVSTPWNHVFALDAAMGAQYWHFAYGLPPDLNLCCGAVNRGVAVGSDKVVFATLDAHLMALDARTGEIAWKVQMADYRQGYSATLAPQVIGNKVIAGISGGVFGIRGFIDAYDIDTGERIWRFWTVPGPGEPGNETWEGESWRTGGGPAWMTCTYDVKTNTIFAGIGSPGPVVSGETRHGANLYTECTVALNADNGRLKWYYQVIPHDVWGLDNAIEPVIDDITIDGRNRRVVMFASRNGYFYVLDRADGAFIYALPFSHRIDWGAVRPDGSVKLNSDKFPVRDRWTEVFPGGAGGREWVPVAYDPRMKRMFVPCIENGHRYKVIEQGYKPGLLYRGGVSEPIPNAAYGHIAAIDVEKKRIAWDVRTTYPMVCGVTCTASGLVITGTPDQKAVILDGDNGKVLWSFEGVSGWHSAPVVYSVGNTEYIAFANGWGGWVAGVDLMGTPGLEGLPTDNILYVFSLPQKGGGVGPIGYNTLYINKSAAHTLTER
ncbi:MAG TPA: PQQ-dependent dehydrogenase, methanol/ethanol family [Deltaproteobacteria bacterium]|nr:PQQ-dependent dehydrogenase, methanol/ethanol family [Deltaproteobacteria bacterium]